MPDPAPLPQVVHVGEPLPSVVHVGEPLPSVVHVGEPLPSVVHVGVKHLRARGYRSLVHWLEDPRHVYIGRRVVYVAGADQSRWANPYSLKHLSRDEAIAMYRAHLDQSPELLASLGELSGALEIGCFCSPEACHGDVLVEKIAAWRAQKMIQEEER